MLDGQAVRNTLAKRIMEAAINGELDPARLRDYALGGAPPMGRVAFVDLTAYQPADSPA